MIRRWKTAPVGMSLVLVIAALVVYAYTRVHAAPSCHFANGIEVTPIEVPPDDVAKVLGIKIWKFDVFLPDDRQGLQLTLNLCHGGKIIRSVGGSGFIPMKGQRQNHYLITLGLAPDDGDFSRGKRIKYFVEGQSGATSGSFTNPLQGSNGLGCGPDDFSAEENSVYLIGGGKVGMYPITIDDTALAFTITPEKPLQ